MEKVMEKQVIVDRRDSGAPTAVTVLLIALALLLAWFFLGDGRLGAPSNAPATTDTGASASVDLNTGAQ